MSGLRAVSKLAVLTMRLSSLPPKARLVFLSSLALAVGLFAAGMGLAYTAGHHGSLLAALLIVASVGLFLFSFLVKEVRKGIHDQVVTRETKRLDEHYEELCKRYWRDS